MNGTALNSTEATSRCSHTRRSKRSRCPRASVKATSVIAPSDTRPNATQLGDQCLSSTLMNRKLEPQIAASSTNWLLQGLDLVDLTGS